MCIDPDLDLLAPADATRILLVERHCSSEDPKRRMYVDFCLELDSGRAKTVKGKCPVGFQCVDTNAEAAADAKGKKSAVDDTNDDADDDDDYDEVEGYDMRPAFDDTEPFAADEVLTGLANDFMHALAANKEIPEGDQLAGVATGGLVCRKKTKRKRKPRDPKNRGWVVRKFRPIVGRRKKDKKRTDGEKDTKWLLGDTLAGASSSSASRGGRG